MGKDVEGNACCQLDHVVQHQVDKKDVARTEPEDLKYRNPELNSKVVKITGN